MNPFRRAAERYEAGVPWVRSVLTDRFGGHCLIGIMWGDYQYAREDHTQELLLLANVIGEQYPAIAEIFPNTDGDDAIDRIVNANDELFTGKDDAVRMLEKAAVRWDERT